MDTSFTRGEVLCAFGAYLDKLAVPYVIVGDTSKYPRQIDSDVDMVLPVSTVQQCGQIVQHFASQGGLQVVQLLHHAFCAWCFVLTWKSKQGMIDSLAVDICGDFLNQWKPLIDVSELLSGRRMAVSEDNPAKGFYVPAPDAEFICYLVKKVDKFSVSASQFVHLRSQFLQCPDKCLARLQQFWSAEEARNISNWVRDGDLLALQNALLQLRPGLINKCRPSAKDRWRELTRKIRRVLQPTGLVVALLGPDGCGKSTIGESLQRELAPVFRGFRRFHLRPYFWGRSNGGKGGPVIDPHGQSPRGVLACLAKLLYFLCDYVFGHWGRIRPLKVRSHLVMFDRYYHDLLIDPIRYRFRGPMWLAHWVGKLIPQPDLLILLDAPPEVLQSRKQEVPFAETSRQREAYLHLVRGMNNGLVVDASRPPHEVVTELCAKILAFMSQRTAKRFGLDT